MPKRIVSLLIGLISTALIAQTPVPTITPAQREAKLKGCADLGINTTLATDPGGWGYSIPSPDGTYVAEGRRNGSHGGCYSLIIYQCVNQQSSRRIGCDGIEPGTSGDPVFAKEWISNDELLITRSDEAQIIDARGYFNAGTERGKDYDEVLNVSPDDQWQIFSSFRDGMSELYRRHPDGTDELRLTHSPGVENFYGWSADGQWMIFDYAKPRQAFALLPVRIRPDGSELQTLMTDTEIDQSENSFWKTLTFSPDARWLLMEGYAWNAKHDGLNYVIYRLGIPDGGLTRLTDPSFPYWFVNWSPDGRALLVRSTGKEGEQAYELVDVEKATSTPFVIGRYEFQRWTDDHTAALFRILDSTGTIASWYRAELDGSGVHEIEPPTP